MMEDGGKHRKTAEEGGGRLGTAGTTENDRERQKTTGGDGAQHDVVRPGLWPLLVGQVPKMTGRDDTMSSVLGQEVYPRTTPLRTLAMILPNAGECNLVQYKGRWGANGRL